MKIGLTRFTDTGETTKPTDKRKMLLQPLVHRPDRPPGLHEFRR